MENSRVGSHVNVVFTTFLVLVIFRVNGQISTPCTNSMISSFTPCLSYITGSSANGSSPTSECCDSLKSLVSDSVDCACLVVTGNVPLSLPFNRTLAISLPRICNGGVPLRCKGAGVPLPAPGPVLFGPTQAPIASPPRSPRATKAAALAPPPIETTPEITPSSPPEPALGPAAHPGVKPVLNHPSASNPSYVPSLLLMLLGFLVLKV